MKQTKTTPKNRAFFSEHGGNLSAYGVLGFIGQSLSGLSLAYAVFALLVAQVFADGNVDNGAFLVLVTMAVVVGFFVELANRVLARPAIRPFVVKGQFAEDPETAKRHSILNRSYLVGLVAVALLSYFFSIVGSTYYAEDATDGPELVRVDSIAQAYTAQEVATLRSFSADSATVAGPYDVQLSAARVVFAADSSALIRTRSGFSKCANAGNKHCKNRRRALLTQIDNKRAELALQTAAISKERAAALREALTARDDRLTALRSDRSTDVDEAKATNRAADEERDGDAGFKGIVFIVLTVAGQTLFYFCIYLQLQVEAGSKIEYQLAPNEFWNLPTVLQEFKITAAWRIERGARRLIRWAFGEPNGDHKTAIPYADLYSDNGSEDEDDDAVVTAAVSDGGKNDEKVRTIIIDPTVKECRNCGNDFRPNAHNQKYCTTDCKNDYHTNKHNGRAFDAGRYRGRKPSKT
jgi:hypothetical protein